MQNSLAEHFPFLVKEWDMEKNFPLDPSELSSGSHRKVWWRCGKGHTWLAEVKSRTGGSGCPFCANRSIAAGENDLGTTHPALAAQWCETRNAGLTPSDVVPGSHKRVWWRCEQGHEWRAQISSRAKGGAGCPVCAGRKVLVGVNDLATLAPEIAAQWNDEKNGPLKPTEVTRSCNRSVWWRCEKGHEWKAPVSSRTERLLGCPYCSGRRVLAGFNDLATICPEIAAQWYQPLNGTMTPQMVTAGSRKKVWWECSCGHVWKAVVSSRTGRQKCGCPICAGHVKSSSYMHPLLKPEAFGTNEGVANYSVLSPAGQDEQQTNPPSVARRSKRRVVKRQEMKIN